MGAKGKDMVGTSEEISNPRISQAVSCATNPSYTNKECLSLISSIPQIAASHPDSLEAMLIARMTEDGAGFCMCVDGAFKSAPAQAVSHTCSTPHNVIQFLKNNKKACTLLSKFPSRRWASVAGSVANAMV